MGNIVLSFEPVIGDIFDGMLTLLKDGKVKHVFWTDEEPKVVTPCSNTRFIGSKKVGAEHARYWWFNSEAPTLEETNIPITGWWEEDK